MSRSCCAVDVSALFGLTASCGLSSEFHHPHPAILNDVRVFSPYDRKCLMLKDLAVPLGGKLRMLLGSDVASCDLVLAGKPIDAQHAVVIYHNGCYFIQDLESRGGTYVNGRRISDITELRVGDEISLRPYTLRFAAATGTG